MCQIQISFFCFNPFHSTDLFLYPLKTSENLWYSIVSRGYSKKTVAWNGKRSWRNNSGFLISHCCNCDVSILFNFLKVAFTLKLTRPYCSQNGQTHVGNFAAILQNFKAFFTIWWTLGVSGFTFNTTIERSFEEKVLKFFFDNSLIKQLSFTLENFWTTISIRQKNNWGTRMGILCKIP